MKKFSTEHKFLKAFTIAEMTVVLLILSIVLAAILPVMTTKKGSGSSISSLWKLATFKNNDIWYGTQNGGQSVIVGAKKAPDDQAYARVYINAKDATNSKHLGLMVAGTTRAYLHADASNNFSFIELVNNKKGSNNTFFGYKSVGATLTTGANNVSFGSNNLEAITTGSHNTILGYSNASSANTANYNVAVGYNNLSSTTTGSTNVAVGNQTLYSNTEGTHNVAVGNRALYSNTTGGYNVAVGNRALYINSTGGYNVAVGNGALYTNSTGGYNVAIGYQSSYNNNNAVYNVAVGNRALYTNSSGGYNVAVGNGALYTNSTGGYNVAVGNGALYTNSTGVNNVAVGNRALYTNSTGGYNVAIGNGALYTNDTGGYNVAIGNNALNKVNNSNNTAIGNNALSQTTGTSNTAIGDNACRSVTIGSNKTCVGANSGYSVTPEGFVANNTTHQVIVGDGSGNIFLHSGSVYVLSAPNAGGNPIDATLYVKGSSYTYGTIFSNTYKGIAGGNTAAYYGDSVNANTFQGSDGNATFTGIFRTVSDKNLKNVEGLSKRGLSEINKLEVYDYSLKNKPEQKMVGVIAQEVEKVIPEAVVKNEDGYLTLIQDTIIYTMFNAIKELSNLFDSAKKALEDFAVRLVVVEGRVQALIELNKDFSKQIKELKSENKKLTERIDDLEKRLEKLEKRKEKSENKQKLQKI